MKVVLVNSNYWPYARGGAESSVAALQRGLAQSHIETHVVSLKPLIARMPDQNNTSSQLYVPLLNLYFPFVLKKRTIFIKMAWHAIDLVNLPMSILAAYKIFRLKPDVVHTNNISGYGGFFLIVLKLFRIRVLHTPRDYFLLDQLATLRRGQNNLTGGELVLRLTNIHKRFFSRFVDLVVYTSKYMHEVHERNGCFKGVSSLVIYNGCTTIPHYRYEYRQKPVYNFGYVGRPGKEKGLDLLIKLFSSSEMLSKHNLLIVGTTRLEIEQLVNNQLTITDNIKIIGFCDDKSFYQLLDCVIVPSQWNEPFGRSCAEAMLLGIPVIVSKSGGLPEQIINNDVGRVFGNDDELRAILEEICCHEIQFDPARHRQDVERLFSDESMINAYKRAYAVAIL